MARVAVYIDGFNLYYGCLKGKPYRWLDLFKLSREMMPSDSIESVNYYTARVSARPQNPSAPRDQETYLRALRTTPIVQITFGHFLTHPVMMTRSGVMPISRVMVDKTEEKGSDVNLASHLIRDAFQRKFEVAVLVTNDSDLAEPMRIVRHELGMPVGILNPHDKHSVQLKQLATFCKRIRQPTLAASQFPNQLEDVNGKFEKPAGW